MLECVVNVSEGRRADVVAGIAGAASSALLDAHTDADHNRTVLTLAGPDVEAAARAVTRRAMEMIDIRSQSGAHPRIGAVDVVPFVPLEGSTMDDAVRARDDYAMWAGVELAVPCFLYGAERSLPDVRRGAFTSLRPDTGPGAPHPTAGACAVGARGVLVAYNLWLAEPDVALAQSIAASLRSPDVRALGLAVDADAQVSCNLVSPDRFGPGAAYDAVARRARVARAELVGLVPASVLHAEPAERWSSLDLSPQRTIEARLAAAGLDQGSAR